MPNAERFLAPRSLSALPLLGLLVACTGQRAVQATSSQSAACERSSLASAQQVVTKYCASCHSPSGAASDYDWTDEHALLAHRRNVAAKVSRNIMPPPGEPQPTASERSTLLCWANE